MKLLMVVVLVTLSLLEIGCRDNTVCSRQSVYPMNTSMISNVRTIRIHSFLTPCSLLGDPSNGSSQPISNSQCAMIQETNSSPWQLNNTYRREFFEKDQNGNSVGLEDFAAPGLITTVQIQVTDYNYMPMDGNFGSGCSSHPIIAAKSMLLARQNTHFKFLNVVKTEVAPQVVSQPSYVAGSFSAYQSFSLAGVNQFGGFKVIVAQCENNSTYCIPMFSKVIATPVLSLMGGWVNFQEYLDPRLVDVMRTNNSKIMVYVLLLDQNLISDLNTSWGTEYTNSAQATLGFPINMISPILNNVQIPDMYPYQSPQPMDI